MEVNGVPVLMGSNVIAGLIWALDDEGVPVLPH
jgi:hypothetical protein